MGPSRRQTEPSRPLLGPWDATSIVVGIIIGVGIFEIPQDVFRLAPGPWEALGVWALGGLLALVGAFCFAELAGAYPRSGGEYVYLNHAYGPGVGFLFAWAQLTVIRPGGIAALAYVFSDHAVLLWGLNPAWAVYLAALSLLALSAINILGVTLGAYTQNLLTVLKVLGLAAIVAAGFFWSVPAAPSGQAPEVERGWFATAMILVLWTYAGWHEAAYIAAEVRSPRRNVPFALILGAAAVTVIYLLVNAALLTGLGFEAAGNTPLAPTRLLEADLGRGGAVAISVLIMVSALGANNGMIFTTARIYSEFGADHRLFSPLSHWSRRVGTPVRALVVQGLISVAFLFGVWFFFRGKDSLRAVIDSTAAVFWLFFLLTGVALFVLRRKEPGLARPFRVPGYPVLPAVFCACCAYMVYGAVRYRPAESFIGLAILAAGWPFYYFPQKRRPARAPEPLEPVAAAPDALAHRS